MDVEVPAAASHAALIGRLIASFLLVFSYALGAPTQSIPRPSQDMTVSPTVTSDSAIASATTTVAQPLPKTVPHVVLPEEVRGIYLTGYTAGSRRLDELMSYARVSHLNTFVVDLKLDDGTLVFVPDDPALRAYAPKNPAIVDLDALLTRLHDAGIYRIARLFVMRDRMFGSVHPALTLKDDKGELWLDKTKTPWLDPAAPEVADYAIALAREAYARGFDEIQFDYLRFPSDGKLSAIKYPVYDGKMPKAEVMRIFFEKLGQTLRDEDIPVSFDLFGLVCCAEDDLGIGQRLVDALPNADYISPMTYPSHYADGFHDMNNPAKHPYEVVKASLDQNIVKLELAGLNPKPSKVRKRFRPWLQDFDIGAEYDASMVQAQINAARDAGASGWLIWNARNVYTETDYVGHDILIPL